ncbi:hypothetical protein [Azospirillum thiophilum]|uniref:hypothetical protein n=1 Tax=Azospirillum thiophilum TaxID=528244 RepID=UPI0011875C92|nr:hypothetical protein [Azospirillum thiophilum]
MDKTQLITIAAPVIALFGAAIGAVIAFFATKYNADTSRKNALIQARLNQHIKISDFRQNWINDLRNAMAGFQSYGTTPGLDHMQAREFYEFGTKIELLMNPNDEDYNNLTELLYRYLAAREIHEKFNVNAEFIEICQRILKREWERTKIELMKPLE